MAPSTTDERQRIHTAIDRLIDEYRLRCLWFLRQDYYPTTDAERLRVLDDIRRNGDRDAFKRAGELRKWLSPPSSADSVAS